jgi:hypothetical protein
LINGCYIRMYQGYSDTCRYKLYEGNQNPLMLLKEADLKELLFYTRKKDGKIILDKKVVRSEDGRKYIKKQYKRFLIEKKNIKSKHAKVSSNSYQG